MRSWLTALTLLVPGTGWAADVESRVLTHYLPQDFLEAAVRTQGWTVIPLAVAGGVRQGDVVRIWAGGMIDRDNADQPGLNVAGPDGLALGKAAPEPRTFALSSEPGHAFALLFKTEQPGFHKAPSAGKALEMRLGKDKEQLWIGFNDERGRYFDNHLGRGRRHELDPLWIRIEVVRMIVD
jgi:hypothetical protein